MTNSNIRFIAVAEGKDHRIILSHVTNPLCKNEESSYIEMVNKMMASSSWSDPSRVYPGIKHSLESDSHSLHFTYDGSNDFCYITVTSKSYPARVAFQLLSSLKALDVSVTTTTLKPGCLNKKIGKKLKEAMTLYEDPSSCDKITKVSTEVDSVRIVMQNNINSVLANTEKMEGVEEKTIKLNEQAKVFKSTGTSLSRHMWWKNIRFNIMISLAIILVLIILLAMAGAFSSSSSNDDNDNDTNE